MLQSIKVWDMPTRVFHWLLAFSFAAAFITAESERWLLWHLIFGYTVGGLIAFRLVWGIVGTRWSRFSSFLPSPSKAFDYALSLVGKGSNQHYVGHNPLGALAVYALLLLGIIVTASGYGYQQLDQEWLEEVHEVAANGMLALVVLHVVGVIISSVKHRENLVRGMVTGNKQGEPQQAIKHTLTIPALLLLLLVGGFWFGAWQQPSLLGINGTAEQTKEQQHDVDED